MELALSKLQPFRRPEREEVLKKKAVRNLNPKEKQKHLARGRWNGQSRLEIRNLLRPHS